MELSWSDGFGMWRDASEITISVLAEKRLPQVRDEENRPCGLAVSTVAKLKRCHQMPMPGSATTNVEMTCLQGLADLERLEGPWLDGLATGDPEVAATTVRLLLAHLTWNSKRLLGAMVLDRLEGNSKRVYS